MTRTLLLGALGLAFAVALGLGVHVLTRDTVARPVVRLEEGPALAPPATTATVVTTTRTTRTDEPETDTTTGTETDDDSGRGRGRNRGRGGDDDDDD